MSSNMRTLEGGIDGAVGTKSFEIFNSIKERNYIGCEQQRDAAIKEKFNELLTALHEAINSSKGVVPKSADKFYIQDYYNDLRLR